MMLKWLNSSTEQLVNGSLVKVLFLLPIPLNYQNQSNIIISEREEN